jgi:membrane protein DedA with SNARE-associated domain
MPEMTDLLARHGLALVFVNVLLAQAGVPLPAVPLLVVAGASVMQGEIGLLPLLLTVVAASLMGDIPWYAAGRRYGYRILGTLCRVAIEPDSCVRQTESIFARWGGRSLMAAKFIPGFSTVAPPLAGTMRLPFQQFLAYSAVGALAWAAAPVSAGAVFRAEVEWVLARLEDMGAGALAVIGVALAAYLGVKVIERYLLIRFMRMMRIGVDELHRLLQEDVRPVILDARSALARSLDPRHIPGALAVDMVAPERHLSQVSPEREVVVYCS